MTQPHPHAHHTPSRSDGWRERLLSFATITAIAALIWNWASTQTRQVGEANCRIHFVAADADAQSVGPPEPVSVRIQFTGSKPAVDAAVNAVNGRVFDIPVGSPGVPSTRGGHEISLADVISQMSLVDSSGAHVRSVQPSTASIAIESRTQREQPGG